MIGRGNQEEVSPGQGLPDSEGSKKNSTRLGVKKRKLSQTLAVRARWIV